MRLFKLALCLFTLLAATAANAYTINNTNGGDGFLSGSFPSFTLHGGNNGAGNNFTTYSETTSVAGEMSFEWIYSSLDVDGPSWDPAGYFVNSSFTQLSPSTSGSVNLLLAANDLFGWYVFTVDGGFGEANLTVSAQFTPTSVPEPASMALLGLGLAGIAFARRKSQKQ